MSTQQRTTHRAPGPWSFRASAKGAARTAKRTRNSFAPHSVLREFFKKRITVLTIRTQEVIESNRSRSGMNPRTRGKRRQTFTKERKGCGAHRQPNHEL